MITAFVAEYFGGPQNGLGYRITSNLTTSKNAVAWAYVFGAVIVGLAFYLISIAVENLIQTHPGRSPTGRANMKHRFKLLGAGVVALPLIAASASAFATTEPSGGSEAACESTDESRCSAVVLPGPVRRLPGGP